MYFNTGIRMSIDIFYGEIKLNLMIIIFWEMTPCGSYKNRRFGGSYRLHLQGARVRAGTERSCKLLYRQRLVEYYAKRGDRK
jgi:hypothetical protein